MKCADEYFITLDFVKTSNPIITCTDEEARKLASFCLYSFELEQMSGFEFTEDQKLLIDYLVALNPNGRRLKLMQLVPNKKRMIDNFFRSHKGGVSEKRCTVELALFHRIHSNISNHAIQNGFKPTSFNKQSLELVLGYTIADLKKHLESKFDLLLSWENMNEWHIDHIIPKSIFKFKSFSDKTFLDCWCLENLRPLLATENMWKGSKVLKSTKRRK